MMTRCRRPAPTDRWYVPLRRPAGRLAGVAVLATLIATVGLTPAGAHRPGRAATAGVITAGEARFEVLSPTLIRTEYAGDARFLDSATFNVIGRDSFAAPSFTSREADGWLTISTAALTLRYRLGSGPFTAENLTVRVRTGSETVTAAPWNSSGCALGALCEAEATDYAGVGVATDHAGFTGAGFLAGFTQVDDSLTMSVDVPAAGSYQLSARYANGLAGDGQHLTRTLTLAVDAGAGRAIQWPATDNWDTWGIVSVPVELTAGRHRISLAHRAADTGHINVDAVALDRPGAAFPTASPALDCRFGASCEAETGALAGTAAVRRDHSGYSGEGFVAELNQGSSLTTHLVGVPAAGVYTLHVRYANGRGGDNLHQTRTATVTAGGATTALSLPATDGWDAWSTASGPVTLPAGDSDIVVGCPEATSCHVNVDTVAVTPAGSAMPTPHAALGGYRRSVDLVNGEAPTTPGLLYRDGWYLLDDTPSALYDTATRALTPRPDHGSQPYQDGYVFGYGHNYKQGLSDLAALTGPSMLLPRWAYGVWYSEYYDHTAADYQNTIIPMFRSAGVPLDVLVTDTDFKTPSTWNGWQIDPKKFPDPQAYFAWLHAQGLHTTFNIHSSIDGSDPQFAQAQATAKGKLISRGGCSDPLGCYEFDWADPDQLKAYFDLHQPMERQGVDFWWLDLCCDGSRVRRNDVTSDAWINQKYAEDTSKNIGRGFAFSRAYGTGPTNNQPNLPTGPWADKRTTVHFTGDTYSTWQMLAAEVGSTPAESAATGLSAVSHDIGGFNNAGDQAPGAEKGSTKLADDLYARWVQLGTFQPIDRLHGDHSDRLPWQYGPAARASAEKFLNLREALLPYTYTLAEQASRTGVPVVRATYLEYPEEPEAYAAAGREYLYGPDVLVAPITSAGTTATVSVWFPPGEWTDYFTGKTYAGGSTQTVSADLDTMPVFIRAGGILATRSANVTDDVRNPLTRVTLSVPSGAAGSFRLFEDDGVTTARDRGATTDVSYAEGAHGRTLTIRPTQGSFPGQVARRTWTVAFLNAAAPTMVAVNGARLAPDAWSWDAASRRLTVTLPERSVRQQTVVSYRAG